MTTVYSGRVVGPRTSVGRIRIPRSLGCLVIVVILGALWGLFEIEAQRTVLSDIAGVYRDPDHRLRPSDRDIGTNSDGLRCALEPGTIPEEAYSVFFLGDSFVFGVQVDREEALPQLFERGLRGSFPDRRIDVVNAAWPSSSPVLGLRLLRDVGARYRPDLVLYGFDMSDFRDDEMYRNLLERRGIYRIAARMPATVWLGAKIGKRVLPEPLFHRLFRMPSDRFFCVNRPLEETRGDMMPAWNSLVEIDRFCRQRLHAEFRLVVLPRNFQYSDRESPFSWEQGDYEDLGPWVLEPFRFFEEQARTVSFPVHSLLPAFRETEVFPTCYTGDPHWTPAGTRVAADALVGMAVEERWLDDDREDSVSRP